MSSSVIFRRVLVRHGVLFLLLNYIVLTTNILHVCGQPPVRQASFTVSFDYTCRDWNADVPNICQTPKFNITSPLTVRILGFNDDIHVSCNAFLGKGFGKGTHLSVFLYNMVTRLGNNINFNEDIYNMGIDYRLKRDAISSASNEVRPKIVDNGASYEQSDDFDHLSSRPPVDSSNTTMIVNRTDTFGDPELLLDGVPFHAVSQTLRAALCSHDYSIGPLYGVTECPSECGFCTKPLFKNGFHNRWHNGDGLCIMPIALKGGGFWCINDGNTQIPCEPWMLKYSKIFLYNHSDENDPCDTSNFGHKPDVTKLQCIPNV